MQPAAVILAAGASSRFGGPKQLAPLDGGTLLDAVVGLARRAELKPVIAVVPPTVPLPAGVLRVDNNEPDAGLSRSLQLGLRAVPADVDAAVILLGDQPTVPPELVRRLVASRGARPIVAAVSDGLAAPPILLERSAFELAERATGDAGLRELLRAQPQLVRAVEVIRHAPDVDEPADLAALEERCPGCGARYSPVPEGETHPYIGASPACWAAFGEVLAREFQGPAYGWIHRHTVDAYTVQHPGHDDRRQRQSVALHLIGLCHWLEHGLQTEHINRVTQRLANSAAGWPWLDAPEGYELTVQDVLAATSGEEHGRYVRHWGESVWEAWSEHHDLIRRWAAEALD
jgi:CTP:molybdopterin cytidylyltransferase MocA